MADILDLYKKFLNREDPSSTESILKDLRPDLANDPYAMMDAEKAAAESFRRSQYPKPELAPPMPDSIDPNEFLKSLPPTPEKVLEPTLISPKPLPTTNEKRDTLTGLSSEPLISPTATIATSPEAYSDELNDEALKQAQDQNRKGLLLKGLMQGAGLVGAGIGRSSINPEYTKSLDTIEELGKLPSANIQERRRGKDQELKRQKELYDLNDEQSLRDPNSPASRDARNNLKSLFPKLALSDNITAKQLKEQGYNLGTLLGIKESAEARKQQRQESLENKKEEKARERDVRYSQKFNDSLNKLDKEKAEATSNIDTATALSDEAVKSPAASTNLARSLIKAVEGAGSRVSDKDFITAMKAGGVTDRAVAAINDAKSGTIPKFQADDIKRMLVVMRSYQDKKFKDREDQMVYRQGKLLNRTEEQVRDQNFRPAASSNSNLPGKNSVSNEQLNAYAKQYNKTPEEAKTFLESKGYVFKP